jgi:two-component system nitrate/nitrite response regulator NarL
MARIKLAIADDNEFFRSSLIQFLSSQDDIECVIAAENGLDLLERLKSVLPLIILMDLRMPIMDGIEAASHIRSEYPFIKVIALSQYDCEENIIKMYANGVRSFIQKDEPIEELLRAIRASHENGLYMTEKIMKVISRYLDRDLSEASIEMTPVYKLSQTELNVMWLVAQLKSVKEIADILLISPNTVNNHEVNIRRKLGLIGHNSLQQYSLKIRNNLSMKDGMVAIRDHYIVKQH